MFVYQKEINAFILKRKVLDPVLFSVTVLASYTQDVDS